MKKSYLPVLLLLLVSLLCLVLKPSVFTLILAVTGVCVTTVVLYVPSAWIEDGFAAVSYRLRISSLIAGAVFLSMASSSPEFFISFSGVVLHGVFDIGIITVLWSALFNLCIIIGVCSMYKSPLKVNAKILKRDMPFYGVAILSLVALGADAKYSSIDFMILILIYLIYVGFLYFDKSRPYEKAQNESWRTIVAKISIGLILVGLLSHTLVTMGLRIITISESLFNYVFPVGLIALLIFAPATSISDLFMSIAATKKGEDSTAIINGVGSNTFDLTICLGVPGLLYTLLKGQNVVINPEKLMSGVGFVVIGYVIVFIFTYTHRKVFKWEGVVLSSYFLTAVVIESILLLG